jgi:hypothetical protein
MLYRGLGYLLDTGSYTDLQVLAEKLPPEFNDAALGKGYLPG